MRIKVIEPEAIIEKTIAFSHLHGFENISTKKIAQELKISEGSIFNSFPTKANLLTSCLSFIDTQIDSALRSVHFDEAHPLEGIRSLWYAYFNFFLMHPGYAKYYRAFCQSSYYEQISIEERKKSFVFFSTFLYKHTSSLKINPMLFWVFVIETTLNFAVRVSDKQLPDDPESIEKYFNLMMLGISSVYIV